MNLTSLEFCSLVIPEWDRSQDCIGQQPYQLGFTKYEHSRCGSRRGFSRTHDTYQGTPSGVPPGASTKGAGFSP
jgi:hypothetical protein